jgi:hypothetical protein
MRLLFRQVLFTNGSLGFHTEHMNTTWLLATPQKHQIQVIKLADWSVWSCDSFCSCKQPEKHAITL